jgi:hypothetical protein
MGERRGARLAEVADRSWRTQHERGSELIRSLARQRQSDDGSMGRVLLLGMAALLIVAVVVGSLLYLYL